MKISDISIKRPVGLISILIIAILLGVIGLINLPVDLFPEMSIAKVYITTTYPGAGPKEVEELVTEVLEKKLSSVVNLKQLTSFSYDNYSVVELELNDGTDLDDAADNIRDKLDGVENKLPEDASSPRIIKMDPSALPVMRLVITPTDGRELESIKTVVEEDVASMLQRIEGVASIDINGFNEREIRIVLDEEKLFAYDLNASTIIQSISYQNMKIPVGSYTRGTSEINLSVDGNFTDIDEIRELPIQTNAGLIKLGDIAEVENVVVDTNNMTILDGMPCITLSINKQSDANTVEVASTLREKIESIEKDFPELSILINKDDSETINTSISSVISAGVIGGILAIIILFIFLSSGRSTFIISTAIPISIVITFAMMYFLGVGLNMISLMGLALGIGMLVDNSIVVLENIYRYKGMGYSSVDAAKKGVSEVGLAIIASTLTSIAVFLPIVFLDGFAAQVFRDMSLTVTSSLIASLLIALTLVPMLSSRLLKDREADSAKKKSKLVEKVLAIWDSAFKYIEDRYRDMLRVCIKHRYKTALGALIILLLTLSTFPMLGMEFMPEIDEGKFKVKIELPSGTIIEETQDVLNDVDKMLATIPEIESKLVKIDGNTAEVNCDIGSRVDRDRTINEIMEQVRVGMKLVPGAEINVSAVSLGSGAGGGGSKPFSVEIYGDDYDTLVKISNDFSEIIQNIEGTREVSSSISDGGFESIIKVDREKASRYGLTVGSVATELRNAINGTSNSTFKLDGDEVDIRVVYDEEDRDSYKAIKDIPITTPSGKKIPLSEIAEIEKKPSPSEIKRVDQTRVATIESAIYGRDVNSIKKDANEAFKLYDMEPGYEFRYGTGISSMMESFVSLGGALIISIILIYFIMSAQFESFLYPFIIMFSVPYALTGGIILLFLTGTPLSIVGIIGFIMLVGIVVNNAIVLIEYTNQLREEGKSLQEALLIAGPIRLKPILMTTLTTVLGMLPLAIGMGQGAEMQAPLARVIVGGLSLSTFVTLILIPVNYVILEGVFKKKKAISKDETLI